MHITTGITAGLNMPAMKLPLIYLLGLLGISHAAAAAAAAASNSTPELSCDAVAQLPVAQRCSFLQSRCPSESLVPYAEWYYCHVANHNVFLRFMYVAVVCCLLPLAFCLLGDTAEFYIAPIMAHVSQAIPKMRPRFAGVTFVALGNGAPDLSANIAAISAGEVVLSAGALTGAAMFVQCIVAAELVLLGGPSGIKCGGAMLRDVGVYCLAIFSVLLAFTIGQVSRAFVGWAIALYIIYMIWVFAGDEWHQRGRPKPSLSTHTLKALLAGQLPLTGAIGALNNPAGGTAHTAQGRLAAIAAAQHGGGYGGGGHQSLEDPLLLPWAVAEDEEYSAPTGFEQGQHLHSSAANSRIASVTTELSDFGVGGPSGGGWGRSFDGSDATGHSSSSSSRAQSSSMQPAGSAPAAVPFLTGLPPALAGGGSLPGQALSSSISPAKADPGQQQQRHVGSSQLQRNSYPGGQPSSISTHAQVNMRTHQRHPASMLHLGQRQNWQQQQQQPQPHLLHLGSQNYIDARTYKQLVWADLADDAEEEARLERQIAQQLLAAGSRQLPLLEPPDDYAGSYQPPAADASTSEQQQQHYLTDLHQQQRPSPIQQQQQPYSDSQLLLSPFGNAADRSGPSTPGGLAAEADVPGTQREMQQGTVAAAAGGPGDGEVEMWQQLQWQVTLGNSEEWEDAGPVRKWFRKVTFPLLLPAYLGQRLTIPFASGAGYSREWLIASLLCCPLAAIMYLGWFSLTAVYVACGCGIAAAGTAALLTSWDTPEQMPVQGLGGAAGAFVPGLLAVLAFCMGVIWIDTIATEVVGVITFLAGLASLPSGVMGLTLLAWGNSLGDFFGNRAMAKAGHTSTAITACFAAPLFNMLISLSLGFSAYLHELGATSVKVKLTPEVALGCLFLMGYNVAIIGVGWFCGHRLPRWFAYFARGWYGLYFVLSVVSGFLNISHS